MNEKLTASDIAKTFNTVTDAHYKLIDLSADLLKGKSINSADLINVATAISSNLPKLRDIANLASQHADSPHDPGMKSYISLPVMYGMLDMFEQAGIADMPIEIRDDADSDCFAGLTLRAQWNVIRTALYYMEKCKNV